MRRNAAITARMTGRRHRLACTVVALAHVPVRQERRPRADDTVVGDGVVGDRRRRVGGEREGVELAAGHDLGGVRTARRRRAPSGRAHAAPLAARAPRASSHGRCRRAAPGRAARRRGGARRRPPRARLGAAPTTSAGSARHGHGELAAALCGVRRRDHRARPRRRPRRRAAVRGSAVSRTLRARRTGIVSVVEDRERRAQRRHREDRRVGDRPGVGRRDGRELGQHLEAHVGVRPPPPGEPRQRRVAQVALVDEAPPRSIPARRSGTCRCTTPRSPDPSRAARAVRCPRRGRGPSRRDPEVARRRGDRAPARCSWPVW